VAPNVCGQALLSATVSVPDRMKVPVHFVDANDFRNYFNFCFVFKTMD